MPLTLSRVFFLRWVSVKDPKRSRDRIDEWKWIPLWLLPKEESGHSPRGSLRKITYFNKLITSKHPSHRRVFFYSEVKKRKEPQKSRSLDRRRSGRDSWARKFDKVNKSIVDGLTWKMNSMTWRIFAALFLERFCPLFDKVMRGSWCFWSEEQMHQKIVHSRYVFIYGPEEICKLHWVWWLEVLEGVSGMATIIKVELVCY